MDAPQDYDDEDNSSITSDELASEDAGSIDDDEQANVVEPLHILDDEENPDEDEEDEENFDDI